MNWENTKDESEIAIWLLCFNVIFISRSRVDH